MAGTERTIAKANKASVQYPSVGIDVAVGPGKIGDPPSILEKLTAARLLNE
jgi:hypothetical protein